MYELICVITFYSHWRGWFARIIIPLFIFHISERSCCPRKRESPTWLQKDWFLAALRITIFTQHPSPISTASGAAQNRA